MWHTDRVATSTVRRVARSVGVSAIVAVSAIAGVSVAAVSVAGCVSEAPAEITDRQRRFDEVVDLPAPEHIGDMSVEAALTERRSRRDYAAAELPIDVVGQLLWAGQGVTSDAGYRTAPSAGATYPLELYAVTAAHVMHYLPADHRLERRPDRTTLDALETVAFGQDVVSAAPFVIVVVGVAARTEAEYGALADAFVEREAGHATQNILLQATALDLATVPIGGFDPVGVARLLALPPGHEVLYLVPIGEAR